MRKRGLLLLFIIVLVVALIIAIGAAFYFYWIAAHPTMTQQTQSTLPPGVSSTMPISEGVSTSTIPITIASSSSPTQPTSSMETISLIPSLAIEGYKQQDGPIVPAGDLDPSTDCTVALLQTGDEQYCAVSQPGEGWSNPAGTGVVEIYFTIPPKITTSSIVSADISISLVCSSLLDTYTMNSLDQWEPIGSDLPSPPSAMYDGSTGDLSCLFGGAEQKNLDWPIKIYGPEVGIRIVKGEAQAYALVDYARLNLSVTTQ